VHQDHESPSWGRAPAPPARRRELAALFLLFSQLGLMSFGGGVSAWMHRTFVAQRGWLNETEFSAALALARIVPGVNVINLAVLIGQRRHGRAGAALAALGLILGPGLAAIALAALYQRLAGTPILHGALAGAAAAAAGLLIAMGLVSAADTFGRGAGDRRPPIRRAGATAIMAAVFVLIGLLHLPTVPVVLALAPISIALARVVPADPRENGDDRG
jgi:chromate transporter